MKTKECKKINLSKLANRKVIDLVIPCYKAKNTLIRLLASVVTQTMSSNMNIIIVQDCDEEDYSDIIALFNKMLTIKLVKLEDNRGPGVCRRIGRKSGKCKYIMYMDADDTFQNPFAVEELYTAIEGGKFDAVNSIFLEQCNDAPTFISHDNDDWVWMFGKIYRRKFLEDNNIEMNDSRANEDTGFNAVVRSVGKTAFLPDVTYIWHYKEESITRKDGGIYRFTGIKGWLYNVKWAIDNMIRLNTEEEKIKEFVADNIISTYVWFLEFIEDNDIRVNVDEYKKWVHKYYIDIYLSHTPTEKQLNTAFANQSDKEWLAKRIPKYTFEEYLRMVAEAK